MEKKKGIEYKQLENGKEPFSGAFLGEERHFGLPNKTFKVYLEGEGEDGEKTLISVQLITPKARKLTKFITSAANLTNVMDGDFSGLNDESLDDFIDLTQELFQISDLIIDKLTFSSLLNLIGFAAKISVSPSN